MSTDISIFNEKQMELARAACRDMAVSLMLPVHLRNKPEDIFVIMLMGHELGLKPMQALQNIILIQGKPTVPPQLMMALIRSRLPGAIIKVESKNPDVTCTTARNREDYEANLGYTATWNMNKAIKMGLSTKDNYVKQAETMLRWRAIAEACRVTFPDIITGIYLPEEFQDFDGKTIETTASIKSEIKDMLEADFPIPEEEKKVGDLYRVQNGKFRGKQLKDLTIEDMAGYREELIKRTTPKKEWETDLISVFGQYLNSLETVNEYDG